MDKWKYTVLGDICEFENGDRGKNYPSRKVYVDSGIPFISAGSIGNDNKLNYLNLNYITNERFEKLGSGKVEKNDFVFCLRGSLGKFAFIDREMQGGIASSLIIIRPSNQIDVGFLNYYLQSDICNKMIIKYNNGAAQPNLSARNLKKFELPLPPIIAQHRIVSKLDALFAEIDASLALIDQNIAQAEALKLSVLDEEFGKIRKKENIFKIEEIAFTKSGATPRRSNKEYWNGNIPWLKSGELNDNKNIFQNTEFITQKGLDNSSAKLFPKGTLLMAMYGATAGKLGILGMEACTNQAVCSIQNNKDFFVEEYLYYYLLMIREQIILDSFGGAQPNISKKYIDNLEVPFPKNKEVQQKIVQKLDVLFEEIDGLVSDYQQKREDLEALKSSLLDQAFKGEL